MFEKGWLVAACLAIGFMAGWIVNGWRMSSDIEHEKVEAVQESANHFAVASKQINESAKDYIGKSEQLKKQIEKLKKELSDAKKNYPVPADCRPDSDRLRVLKNAVAAANRASAGQ